MVSERHEHVFGTFNVRRRSHNTQRSAHHKYVAIYQMIRLAFDAPVIVFVFVYSITHEAYS